MRKPAASLEAQRFLGNLEELGRKVYVPQLSFGFIYLGLGDNDKFLDSFEKANSLAPWGIWLPFSPQG